jgi:hypothetical protein
MRHVDTVRLEAQSHALVRRGALLLEDALRTASLPEAGPSRVLLIRRLPVGVIRAHLPPSSLALTLERVVRQLAVSAVHAGDASAPHQESVFFRDDAEPPVLLAGRLARGEPVTAWFWPLAVQGFHPTLPRDEALRLALSAALQSSAGPAAAVRLVESLHARSGLDALLGALRQHEGPAVLHAFGGAPAGPAQPPGTPAEPLETELKSFSLRAVVARWGGTWGAGDARSVWLAAVALVMEHPGRLADPRLFERATRLVHGLLSSPSEAAAQEAPGVPASGLAAEHEASSPIPSAEPPAPALTSLAAQEPSELPTDMASAASAPEAGTASLDAPAASPGALASSPAPGSLARDTGDMDAAPEHTAAPGPAWPEAPLPTVAGGLLFLVPVLERLGFPALLDAQPALLELNLPERFLAFAAGRLGAPATDASRVLFSTAEPPPEDLGYDVDRVLRGLLLAVQWWCHRRARIGLRRLVHRPARIMATRTHVDVLFDIQQADLRVRGAGLDLDPGWVPWLGRVVRFHYLHGEA